VAASEEAGDDTGNQARDAADKNVFSFHML
jgi:hypothetical protein